MVVSDGAAGPAKATHPEWGRPDRGTDRFSGPQTSSVKKKEKSLGKKRSGKRAMHDRAEVEGKWEEG